MKNDWIATVRDHGQIIPFLPEVQAPGRYSILSAPARTGLLSGAYQKASGSNG